MPAEARRAIVCVQLGGAVLAQPITFDVRFCGSFILVGCPQLPEQTYYDFWLALHMHHASPSHSNDLLYAIGFIMLVVYRLAQHVILPLELHHSPTGAQSERVRPRGAWSVPFRCCVQSTLVTYRFW